MSTRTFAITFDYLCPFARNGNEHVIDALRGGADWDVLFTPFSLAQVHVEEGETAVWGREDPDAESGVLALQAGVAVRDHYPDRFLDAHEALFAARHDEGRDIRDRAVVHDALAGAGLDADAVFAVIAGGEPLDTLRKEHERAAADHNVWGVPTFVGEDRAVFVRVLTRPEGDGEVAARTVERALDLVDGFPELHEFKQTELSR